VGILKTCPCPLLDFAHECLYYIGCPPERGLGASACKRITPPSGGLALLLTP
jgi:hypothetical protein